MMQEHSVDSLALLMQYPLVLSQTICTLVELAAFGKQMWIALVKREDLGSASLMKFGEIPLHVPTAWMLLCNAHVS